jgi:membrane protein required for colicin V production
MTWIDAAIVVVLLFFVVTAFQAGLVRELIAFASTLAGVVVAGIFYDDIRENLLTSIDNETVASAVAFLAIFLTFTVAGQLLAMVVHPVIQVLQLGMADQFMGAAFGVVKAFVLVEALLILFVTYPFWDLDEEINDSEFATRLLEASKPITTILPDVFQSQVDAFTGDDPPPIRQS